ncbi:MAG: hypothetical protein K6G83_00250 [Lachnospiraceae bacterium]|nr:hypothetical protein [Lachnospiraceae bacterium]
MTPMEITLLVIGVIIFAASFFIKDKAPAKSEKDMEKEQREIHELMERELDAMKLRVNDATDETVEYAMDKAERSLEKLSNEKIMAVNEYSDMVMQEIDKNHKEVMFLYDMLSDKQADVSNSVRRAEATVREVETISSAAQTSTEELKRDIEDYSKQKLNEVKEAAERPMTAIDMLKARQSEADIQPVFNTLNTQSFTSLDANTITLTNPEDVLRPVSFPENMSFDTASGMIDTIRDEEPEKEKKPAVSQSAFGSSMMKGFGGAKVNNNQKIIELHEQGKSTVEIAKELNLGVGEVKLVIDLFK